MIGHIERPGIIQEEHPRQEGGEGRRRRYDGEPEWVDHGEELIPEPLQIDRADLWGPAVRVGPLVYEVDEQSEGVDAAI